MHQEKYSLTWHTYLDHLKSMMKELMMNEDYSDVTLVTEDKKEIKANIHVLSACSSIFKDILKKVKKSSTVMYLRGIQYLELESIMQFIYLGETTFYKERMHELLAVAKSLEIKGLFNAVTETNDEQEDEPSTTDPETLNENLKEQTIVYDHFSNGKYECEHCQETFASQIGFYLHNKSVHQVVKVNGKYECKHCQKTFASQMGLYLHNKSVHLGEKYACDKCDFQFTRRDTLSKHIQSKHEGIRYACAQCDYKASQKAKLRTHMKNKHKIEQSSQ